MDSNNQFRQLYKNFPEFDWCKLMGTSSKYSSNILAKFATIFVKRSIPEFVRPCPFPPMQFHRDNNSLPYQFVAMIPVGIYRIMVLISYKNIDMMFNISVVGEIS